MLPLKLPLSNPSPPFLNPSPPAPPCSKFVLIVAYAWPWHDGGGVSYCFMLSSKFHHKRNKYKYITKQQVGNYWLIQFCWGIILILTIEFLNLWRIFRYMMLRGLCCEELNLPTFTPTDGYGEGESESERKWGRAMVVCVWESVR